MIAVQSYLYDNIVQVQILDSNIFTVKDRTVYNRSIKIYQGIDNPVLVQVKNQDQKPVDLSDKSIKVDIQDPNEGVWKLGYTLSWSDSSKGLGKFIIKKDQMKSLDQRYYKLVLRLVDDDGEEQPLYSDDNYGLMLDIEVLPGYINTGE
jgi:hypothetical protein